MMHAPYFVIYGLVPGIHGTGHGPRSFRRSELKCNRLPGRGEIWRIALY